MSWIIADFKAEQKMQKESKKVSVHKKPNQLGRIKGMTKYRSEKNS